MVAAWALTGPFAGFRDIWQPVIKTGTTVATLLMVLPIRLGQNCEAEAVQVKLDESLRALNGGPMRCWIARS